MIFLACLSSLLLYLTFPNFISPFGIGPLAWIFAIPLFFVLDGKPFGYRVLTGILFCIPFFLGFVSWLAPYNTLGYIAFVLVLSVQPMIFVMVPRPKIESNVLEALYIASAWVTAEFLHKVLCYGFSWTIGYSQTTNVYALQIADTLGSHGISFIIIFVNYCLFKIIKYRCNIVNYLFAITFALVLLFGYGFWTLHRKPDTSSRLPLKAAVIQANISQDDRTDPEAVMDIIEQHITLTKDSLKRSRVDIVLWPETAVLDDFLLDADMNKIITKTIKQIKTPFLIGGALLQDNIETNSAVLLDSTGKVLKTYHKKHLVPFSEYVPKNSFMQFLAETFGVQSYDFAPGKEIGFFSLPGGPYFGTAICSEDHYSNLFRIMTQKGAGFAVVLLNDGWFHQKEAFIIHAQSSILRAVENHLPIIRSSNSGWSVWIDQFGQIDLNNVPPIRRKSSAIALIRPNTAETFYSRFGDIFAAFCIFFVIIIFIIATMKKRK